MCSRKWYLHKSSKQKDSSYKLKKMLYVKKKVLVIFATAMKADNTSIQNGEVSFENKKDLNEM